MFAKNKYLVFAILSFFLAISFVAAAPSGANLTQISTGYGVINTDPANNSAYAGNVTEVVVSGVSNTQSWQGYYGNVSGAIQLADGSNSVMYNWSLASPSGEVFASTNSSISWTTIQCFNFTANGNLSDDSAQAGSTSLYGRNVSQLESMFNLPLTSADGVDETFSLLGAGTHDAFFVGSLSFTEGECRSTRVYDSSGAGTSNNFEEVLLYEPTSTSVVFTSILENNVNAFNNKASDFEMLVLEDGHSGNTASTPYYFFIEIQ